MIHLPLMKQCLAQLPSALVLIVVVHHEDSMQNPREPEEQREDDAEKRLDGFAAEEDSQWRTDDRKQIQRISMVPPRGSAELEDVSVPHHPIASLHSQRFNPLV